MDDLSLPDLARQLSGLELALFLSLVAREHCLIETTSSCVDDVAKELALVRIMELAWGLGRFMLTQGTGLCKYFWAYLFHS